jgi:hypothetical protein
MLHMHKFTRTLQPLKHTLREEPAFHQLGLFSSCQSQRMNEKAPTGQNVAFWKQLYCIGNCSHTANGNDYSITSIMCVHDVEDESE